MDNRTIAEKLTGQAHWLESHHRNLYRVKAYRQAAATILGLDEPVEAIVARAGRKGLQSLPGIGAHLSWAIENLVRTGQFRTFNGECDSTHAPVEQPRVR
jgi:DNA polymerase (family 10)